MMSSGSTGIAVRLTLSGCRCDNNNLDGFCHIFWLAGTLRRAAFLGLIIFLKLCVFLGWDLTRVFGFNRKGTGHCHISGVRHV
jgi:hypothetical protein